MDESSNRPRVVVSLDGPYLVTGDIPLAKQTIVAGKDGSEQWLEGEPIPHEASYSLCRCGGSQNKPFCDGTHLENDFDGSETATREPYLHQAQRFEGPTMSLTDAKGLCAFARFCDPNGQVWAQVEQSDDPAVRETFIRQVGNCPAGRLVAWDNATGQAVEPDLPISIGVVEDPPQGCGGPLWLRGGIPVVSENGKEYEVRNRVTLCRCGHSRNKPFCDATHVDIGFTDEA